jgi:PhnB protein
MNTQTTAPAASQTVTVYLTVKDAARAIDFYREAFGAVEAYRLTEPGGRLGHAEITIGNTRLMLADEYPDFGALSPQTIGGSPVKLHVQVPDADAAIARAVAAGATILRPAKNEFYGFRSGMVADPFGFSWLLATQIEEVSPEEMQKRWSAIFETTQSA